MQNKILIKNVTNFLWVLDINERIVINYKRPQTNWIFDVRFPFMGLSYNN
jgi:hypothetical protein